MVAILTHWFILQGLHFDLSCLLFKRKDDKKGEYMFCTKDQCYAFLVAVEQTDINIWRVVVGYRYNAGYKNKINNKQLKN